MKTRYSVGAIVEFCHQKVEITDKMYVAELERWLYRIKINEYQYKWVDAEALNKKGIF